MRWKYEFVTISIEGRTIAVPVGENAGEFRGVLKLNETAELIFELLKKDVTENDIINEIEALYRIDRNKAAADVRNSLEIFRQKGLLIS